MTNPIQRTTFYVKRRSGARVMACFVFAESMFFMHKPCCTGIVRRACTGMHDTRSVKTHCCSGKHIVSFDDTLFLRRIHCVSGRHIVSCVSTMIVVRRSPVARSLGRSLARSLARSIDHSLARSLARSIARSLTDMCSLQSQYKGAAFGRHHKGGRRPSAARPPLWFPLCWH